MHLFRFSFFALIAALFSTARADTPALPFVAPVFADHMVLQRDQADPVWGWAKPGETITVAIAGRSAKAVAGADGKWLAKLTPPPAGGPYELTVSGSQTVTFNDVLVGDVWVCAGQSNMEFGLEKITGADAEIARADHPQMRLLTVKKEAKALPQDVLQLKATWAAATPASVRSQGYWGGFSAVGYFFGRELQQNLKVPVGLIEVAWGSTYAEVWTGQEALAKIGPDFDKRVAALVKAQDLLKSGAFDDKKLREEWQVENGITADVSTPQFDASGWKTMRNLPHGWSGSDDPALEGFVGAVWFRKEIDLPAEAAGKTAELRLGALQREDITWVNGVRVGANDRGDPRTYKIPANLLKPGRNVVATWILSEKEKGGLTGKAEDYSLVVKGRAPVSLAGDWSFKVMTPADQITERVYTLNGNAGRPAQLFNGMIAPLAPFGIKGALWYQGEANVGRAWQYRKLLPALITSWRDQWGQGNFPFLVVQLPDFGPGPGAKPGDCSQAELREAQALAAQLLPAVGVITTIDIGDPSDLHPTNKLPVGQRLALLARAKVYGEAVAYSGPVYKTVKPEGASLRITFDHAEGLHAKNGPGLKNFAVAGEDRVFHWADARIVGGDVVLTSRDVPKPVAARYNWSWSPKGNLYNAADLPTFPFRTDDWPLTTRDKK